MAGASNAWAGEESDSSVRATKQQAQELEHTIIVGVGAATEIELADGAFHSGANAFLEYEAIEDWLELELGISLLAADGGHELPVDLLIKKPFRLSRGIELMIGIGPEIVYVSGSDKNGTFFGGELVFDFMFWPSHHIGLWIEPSYSLIFRSGVSHSLGATGG